MWVVTMKVVSIDLSKVHGIVSNSLYLSKEGKSLLLALHQELATYYYDINANSNCSNGVCHKRSTLYPAYQEAISDSSAFLIDCESCSAFLVADNYDSEKAVIQIIRLLGINL